MTGADEPQQPLWNAFAEIWLDNEQEQLASLQSPEFLEGARIDEPRWAAFWNTLVLDCDTVSRQGRAWASVAAARRRQDGGAAQAQAGHDGGGVPRLPPEVHAPLCVEAPGILRHDVCFTRDSWYVVGEPRFDSVVHFWFENLAAAEALAESVEYPATAWFLTTTSCFDPKYVFHMVSKEHWIIGPEARP